MSSNKKVTLIPLQLIALRFPARSRAAPKTVNLIDGEEWKLVTGYLYVSNLGRVKKMCYNKKGELIEYLYKTQVYNGHLYAQYTEKIERK